jgi:hypothetical protein
MLDSNTYTRGMKISDRDMAEFEDRHLVPMTFTGIGTTRSRPGAALPLPVQCGAASAMATVRDHPLIRNWLPACLDMTC